MTESKGRVKGFFEKAKGLGAFEFTSPEDAGNHELVHPSAIKQSGFKELSEGDRVEFEFVTGPRAGAVTHLGGSQDPALRVIIEPGGAPAEAIADVLSDISILYRKLGGSGINFALHGMHVVAGELV